MLDLAAVLASDLGRMGASLRLESESWTTWKNWLVILPFVALTTAAAEKEKAKNGRVRRERRRRVVTARRCCTPRDPTKGTDASWRRRNRPARAAVRRPKGHRVSHPRSEGAADLVFPQ